MTVTNGHLRGLSKMRRWILIILGILLIIILLLSVSLFDRFRHYSAASYAESIIYPTEEAYCPGDRVFYDVTIERNYPGIIKIVESWCRIGGFCALSTNRDEWAIVPYAAEPEVIRSHVVVPEIHTMKPGQTWVLAHGNYVIGHEDEAELYQVRVLLKDDCPFYNR